MLVTTQTGASFDATMKIQLGRHVYGLAAIVFGVAGLVFRDFNVWQQLPIHDAALRVALVDVAAAVEIAGGVAVQFDKTARFGAVALGVLFTIFALVKIPLIVGQPLVYDQWGNFFEQASLVSGAMLVYATAAPNARLGRAGYYLFGICVISFTLEQVIYLNGTARFVPAWIPPGQMFWAITTTLAFALAAVALLSGRFALLAAQLTTLMIAGFGLLVWLPTLWTSTFYANAHDLTAWAGNAENLAICGSAWILADYLGRTRSIG
ncbi:MAG TPA: hypothetical protein VMB20_06380 [Candidatus Acidoferrum sp.]|nr:hypothetical protein [Candidatus Acidoferrum sp.]